MVEAPERRLEERPAADIDFSPGERGGPRGKGELNLTGTTPHNASAGGICLQSRDRAFTTASTHYHPIPQTGSVLKSQRNRLHPATPR